MASLTQLENFEAAIAAIDPTLQLDTFGTNYIVIARTMLSESITRYALTEMLTKLAHAHNLHFDGYDEMGYPCFINEDEDTPS
jgi:hypothetical protein